MRRISTRRSTERTATAAVTAGNASVNPGWRYLVGTFQINIPVDTEEHLLLAEENTLAIMKWRLEQLSPQDRWNPVMVRYLSYLESRVDAFGGNASTIAPSPVGLPHGPGSPSGQLVERTGKISRVHFDCFGDLDGFDLSECSEHHHYRTSEKGLADLILRACRERWVVTIITNDHNICQLIVKG
jgi:hypothetical protein